MWWVLFGILIAVLIIVLLAWFYDPTPSEEGLKPMNEGDDAR